MKFLAFSVLALAVVASAYQGRVKEKRGAPSQTTQQFLKQYIQEQPQYVKYNAQPSQQYISEPQYETQPEAAAYSAQPTAAKLQQLSSVQKYAAAPQPTAQQYSLAGDVSSFSYSSPVVQYNSLGLLNHFAGKAPQQVQAAAVAPAQKISYAQAAPAPVAVQSPVTYQSQLQKATYTPQQISYSSPAVKSVAAQPLTYSAAAQPLTYSSAAQPVVYSAQPQTAQPQYQQYQVAQAAPQQYQAAHTVQQPIYSSAPQYYSTVSQVPQNKYATPVSHQPPRQKIGYTPQTIVYMQTAPNTVVDQPTSYIAPAQPLMFTAQQHHQPQYQQYQIVPEQYQASHSIPQPIYLLFSGSKN